MYIKPYGYIQLVPPLFNVIAEGDINNINDWKNIGLASIDPNLWGLRRFKESKNIIGKSIIKAVKDSGIYFTTKLDLKDLSISSRDVIAYHEIIYGLKPWEYYDSHPNALTLLKLPMKVKNLPTILLYTNHTIDKFTTEINLAYDIWLTRSSTDMTCSKGDIELMIWLFKSQAAIPAGKIVETIEISSLLNGEIIDVKLDVWLDPELPALPGVSGRWVYIAFTLSNPLKEGVMAIDLTKILSITKDVLVTYTSNEWNEEKFNELYLRSIEFGTEVFYSKIVDVEWTIREFFLITLPINIESKKALQSIINPQTIIKI